MKPLKKTPLNEVIRGIISYDCIVKMRLPAVISHHHILGKTSGRVVTARSNGDNWGPPKARNTVEETPAIGVAISSCFATRPSLEKGEAGAKSNQG